jgi:hypothetical protein
MNRIKVVKKRWLIPVLAAGLMALSGAACSRTPAPTPSATSPRPTLLLLVEKRAARARRQAVVPCHGAEKTAAPEQRARPDGLRKRGTPPLGFRVVAGLADALPLTDGQKGRICSYYAAYREAVGVFKLLLTGADPSA